MSHVLRLPAGCPFRQAANEAGDLDDREITRLAMEGKLDCDRWYSIRDHS